MTTFFLNVSKKMSVTTGSSTESCANLRGNNKKSQAWYLAFKAFLNKEGRNLHPGITIRVSITK
jgi:hypothetical protein